VARRTNRLSDDDLARVLELARKSDSVELKLTVPLADRSRAAASLGVDPLDAQIRQVFFFDTPDLKLQEAGLAVRARRIQGRSGDSVVKLRPVVPDELSEDIRRSSAMNVEVDAMPGGYVCSASMKGKVANKDVFEAVRGKRAVRKVFSKEQRSFFEANAPEGLALDDLRILGPTFVLKLAVEPKKLGRRLVAEVWLLQDGTGILELSTKCPPAETFQTAIETRAYLEGLGLDLEADPQTKTKATLAFFAGRLRQEAVPTPA
jgi:hypothetical protein